MAQDTRKKLAIADQRFGRTHAGYPFLMPDNSCVEAVNVDFYQSACGRKRGGSAALATTGVTFTDKVASLITHVPSGGETLRELWAVDDDGVIGRLAAGTTWAAPTMKDAATSGGTNILFSGIHGVSFNGKFFLTYHSAVDRLHVWDGSTVRRVGLATPVAPTAANTGSGTYAATVRYYKVAWTVQVAGVTVRRSELSPALTFTPSGSGTAARVTQPAVADEGETHWELYGSPDNAIYFLLATTAIATTTADDSTAPASYTGSFPPSTGANVVPTSWKFIVSDQARLLGAGSWSGSQKNNRVWFTAMLGSSDVGDDERVPTTTTSYVDVGENDGDQVTGFVGLVNGAFYLFKTHQIWKLVPTGDTITPYDVVRVSAFIGAIRHETIVVAEDEIGVPAIYFLSQRGPYRLGRNGLEGMWPDIEDLWVPQLTGSRPHGIYHQDKHQIWWWIASNGTNAYGDRMLVFDTHRGRSTSEGVRGGWSQFNSAANAFDAYCSVMFAKTVGSTMSLDLKPYIGSNLGNGNIQKCDTGTVDGTTPFQAYTISRPETPAGLGANFSVTDCYLHAAVSTGVTVQASLIRDFGMETLADTALLTASAANETRVQRRLEGLSIGDAGVIQVKIGDASALDSSWNIDALAMAVLPTERR